MPIDTDPSFWKWLAGTIGTMAGVFGTTGWGYHKYLDNRISKKADKEQVAESFKEVKGELQYQRETQAKIFDKIDDLKTIVLERLPRQ